MMSFIFNSGISAFLFVNNFEAWKMLVQSSYAKVLMYWGMFPCFHREEILVREIVSQLLINDAVSNKTNKA